MQVPGFTDSSYRLETVNASCMRSVNLFSEKIEKGPRAGALRLRGIPGLPTFTTLPDAPMRCLWSNATRCFAVAAGNLYEVFENGTFQLIGNVGNGTNPAIIQSNGFQLAIASAGAAYIAAGGPGVTPILGTDGQPVNAATIAFLDNYFIAAIQNSKEIRISALAPDGATWDPADTAIKEGYSDNIVRVFADNEQLWLFGNETTEIWVDSGGLFPFSRMQSALFSIGCDSAWSVAGVTGIRFWLWKGSIWMAGNSPVRVSDYALEEAIKTYSQFDQFNAEGFAWIDGGHIFYAISFPEASRTWVYDKSIDMWHERLFWDGNQYTRYRPRVYTKVFGRHLVGDYQTGRIYQMDPTNFKDANGAPLRRERICPYITDEMRNVRYDRLTLDMDTGVGLSVGPSQPGYNPQVLMKYSPDRGKTWSNERQASIGKTGEGLVRAIFPQLGSSRIGMAFSTVVMDPVELNFNAAYVDVSPSTYGKAA